MWCGPQPPPPPPPFPPIPSPDIARVGNRIIDRRDGQPVHLKGVGMMGSEYACIDKIGVFAGPADASVIDAMRQWGINAIRLPMNEDCWSELLR